MNGFNASPATVGNWWQEWIQENTLAINVGVNPRKKVEWGNAENVGPLATTEEPVSRKTEHVN